MGFMRTFAKNHERDIMNVMILGAGRAMRIRNSYILFSITSFSDEHWAKLVTRLKSKKIIQE